MKKLTALILLTATFFLSCNMIAPKEEDPVVTIDGNWTLATWQSVPVTMLTNTNGTLTITGGAAYTRITTLNGFGPGTETGSVALNNGSIYTFTSNDVSPNITDMTLSSNGKTLSGSNEFWGAFTYIK